MDKRINGPLLIVVMSVSCTILVANLLVTVFGWRFSLGASAPLGQIESILAYMVIGAFIFPHLFAIPYYAMVRKQAQAESLELKSERVE